MSGGIYEIVVRGRLSIVLIEATGFEFARVESGMTYLVGHGVDRERLGEVLQLLRDVNIDVVSVDELPVPGPVTGCNSDPTGG